MKRPWLATLAEICLIVALSATIGIIWNRTLLISAWRGEIAQQAEAAPKGEEVPMPLGLVQVKEMIDAKQAVLGLAKFYKKPRPVMIPVMGENFRGMTDAILYNMRQGNFASDYDVHVSRKVAHILSGGDCAEGTLVTEEEILALEREAFLSLCGEKKTQDRIMHTLNTGKPLRN